MSSAGAARVLALWVLALGAFVVSAGGNALAEEAPYVRTVGGVVDYATVLNAEERRSLEIEAGQLARRIGTDFFVATINDREAIWADQKSHIAMVQKAYEQLKLTIAKHFEREAPLTVVLVFKSSVVLHLKTSDEQLQSDLLYENFYRKSAGALERIRGPDESHGGAAIRYLAALNSTLDRIADRTSQPGLLGQTELAHRWLVTTYAMPMSRNLTETPVLDPIYRVLCSSITAVATSLWLPGWMSFLLVLATIYLGLHAIAIVLESHFDDKGEIVGDALLSAGSALPLFMLFAVSMPDLENLLVIAQKYASEYSVLNTYLQWSSEIEARTFEVPFATILATATLVGILEATHRTIQIILSWRDIKRPRPSPTLHTQDAETATRGFKRLIDALALPRKILRLAGHVLTAFGWVLSQVIWPGPIAVFFMIVSVARRLIDLYGDWDEAKKAADKKSNGNLGKTFSTSGGRP